MLKWRNKDQYEENVGTQMLIFQLNDLVVVLKGQVYCKSNLYVPFNLWDLIKFAWWNK